MTLRDATIASRLPTPAATRGTVVVFNRDAREYASEHERVTRTQIARRLAQLMGFEFIDEHDRPQSPAGPVYVVPSDTLVAAEAQALGVRSEHDLFGGVVPYPFVATKAITHPLVSPDARAPAGWSHEFRHRVRDAVLTGFSAFTRDDARQAGSCLLERGPVRVKPVHATGGRGQTVVQDRVGLDACLEPMPAAELSRGVVLEEDLTEVTTYSVGQVRVADLVATYHGCQRLTPDNGGAQVYGGSDLTVVRGGFEALLELDLSDVVRSAVLRARIYDAAARVCFPGFFASRVNYDVVHGRGSDGGWRCGVLEQSWRVGGASGAEIAALEAFRREPRLRAVRASCFEVFGDCEAPPPDATVYFRGVDPHAGRLTKYTLIQPHGHA